MRNMRRVGQTPGLRSQGLKRQPNGGYKATPTPPAQQGGDFRMRALQDMNRPKPPSGGFQQPAGMHQQQRPQQAWQQPKAAPQQRQMQTQAQPQRQAPRQQSPGLSVYNQKPAQTKPLHQNQAGDAPLYFKALQQLAPNQNMQGRQYSSQPKQDGWGEQKQWQPAPKYSGGSGEGQPSEKQEESPFDKQDSDLFGAKAVGEEDAQNPQGAQKPGYDSAEDESDGYEDYGDDGTGQEQEPENPMKNLAAAILGSTNLDLGGYDQGAHEASNIVAAGTGSIDLGGFGETDPNDPYASSGLTGDDGITDETKVELETIKADLDGDNSSDGFGVEPQHDSKSDELWDKFMETIDSPTEVFSDEDKAAFEQMVDKQAAQGKADMSQQMGGRGMGASGLVGSGFGNIDSQAASQIQDFHIQARQMDVENELNRLKTVAQVYGQTLTEEQRMEIFEKMNALEQEKWADDQERMDKQDGWNAILNEMGLKGDEKLSPSEYEEAMARWGLEYPGQSPPMGSGSGDSGNNYSESAGAEVNGGYKFQSTPPEGVPQEAWESLKDYATDAEKMPPWLMVDEKLEKGLWTYISDEDKAQLQASWLAEWASLTDEERLRRATDKWKEHDESGFFKGEGSESDPMFAG